MNQVPANTALSDAVSKDLKKVKGKKEFEHQHQHDMRQLMDMKQMKQHNTTFLLIDEKEREDKLFCCL